MRLKKFNERFMYTQKVPLALIKCVRKLNYQVVIYTGLIVGNFIDTLLTQKNRIFYNFLPTSLDYINTTQTITFG